MASPPRGPLAEGLPPIGPPPLRERLRAPRNNLGAQNNVYGLDPYDIQVLTDAPLGYWPLDDPQGTTASDLSGSSWPGTYTGGVTLAQAGADCVAPSDMIKQLDLL